MRVFSTRLAPHFFLHSLTKGDAETKISEKKYKK